MDMTESSHIALVQILLVACQLHSINPYTYRVDELVPRAWKETFADDPLVSDLQRSTQ